MSTYNWVLLVTSLAFLLALALCFLDAAQRRELVALRARVDRLDPPPERGRHRSTHTGSTAAGNARADQRRSPASDQDDEDGAR